MNRQSSSRAARRFWPTAANAAFVSSALEIISFVSYFIQRNRVLGPGASSTSTVSEGFWLGLAVAIALSGVATQASALWGVGQRQAAVAPVSAWCGQGATAAYVAISGMLLATGALGLAFGRGISSSFFYGAVTIPLVLACGFLGVASMGGKNSQQRWASRGLLLVAAAGGLRWALSASGWTAGQNAVWIGASLAGLRSVAWAAVGAWLRRIA